MKIKSMLFPFAVIAIVAGISYYIGGSMQGTNFDKQSIPTADELDYSSHSRINNVDETSQEQGVASASVSEQIEAIEAEFEGKKQKVEEYYTNQFLRLRENVEISLKKLDAADKTAYAYFMEQLNNTTSTSTGYTSVTGRVSPYGTVSGDGLHIETTKTRVEGNPASKYELKVQQLKKAASDLINEYKMDLEHLQRRRDCDISDLEKEKKKAIIAASYQHINVSVHKSTPIAQGTVSGILFSEETALAVINGEVLKEGQSITGVKVVKISQDSVEFEYARTRWSQKVNEQPSDFWP